ncbi:MAG: hypothetical protein PHC61_07915 [Chitinivibrionales bacterium]|nr:hypothetical protein [Chitinivibrionales bacterium]
MGVATIGAILDKVQNLEKRQIDFYADLRDRTTNDGVKLLTYYLARHKQHFPSVMSCFNAEQIERIRNTPFLEEDELGNMEQFFQDESLPSDAKADALLDRAIAFVQVLVTCFQHMADQPVGETSTQLFKSLYDLEVRDIVTLKKMKAMNYF